MTTPAADILTTDTCGKTCVVTILTPELNSHTAEELSTRLLTLLNESKTHRFVLDFAQVRYMESACFGALVNFLKWLARFDGKIAITNVNENVRFLFAVTKLDKVFPLYPDVPSAISYVES